MMGALCELFAETELSEHIKNKLVNEQWHETLPLRILNYGARCQFDNLWDDITMACRGLIVTESGEVVARPFRKFFNLGTGFRPETQVENLPQTEPEITEKLDGSLGILWQYDGHRGIATRGSFASDQSRWATAWYLGHLSEATWPEDHTPLFEIIYKANRIVVSYEQEGLTLLSIVNNHTGAELPYAEVAQWAERNGIPVAKCYDITIAACREHDQKNFEGFVLTWHNPYIKVKVKLQEYMRLHRLVTSFSPIAIWEHLRYGWPFEDYKTGASAEFVHWVDRWQELLQKNFSLIEQNAERVWAGRPTELPDDAHEARKTLALYFTQPKTRALAGILFKKLDARPYGDDIWKSCRPHGTHAFKPVDE